MSEQTELRFAGSGAAFAGESDNAVPMHRIFATREFHPPLTPRERGQAGASDALDGVGGGVPLAVRREMQRVVLAERFDFTTDLLDGRFSQPTRDILHHKNHRNALAGMITTLAKAGRIRFTGQYVRSVRPEARGRMLKVWAPASPRGTESDTP